jgi:hypothetical protein
MNAHETPRPVPRAMLDAAALERIAAAVQVPHDSALCAIAGRMRERCNAHDELLAALRLLLDQVDYTKGACGLTEMVGACLDAKVIDKCRATIAKGSAA